MFLKQKNTHLEWWSLWWWSCTTCTAFLWKLASIYKLTHLIAGRVHLVNKPKKSKKDTILMKLVMTMWIWNCQKKLKDNYLIRDDRGSESVDYSFQSQSSFKHWIKIRMNHHKSRSQKQKSQKSCWRSSAYAFCVWIVNFFNKFHWITLNF